MAEKRRSGIGMPDSKSGKAETDNEFLSQAGVSSLLRNALLKLVEARSEDPIGFLAEHFSNLASETENGTAERGDGQHQHTSHEQQRLTTALWHLNLAHHSQRSAFNNNIRVAYDLLTQNSSGCHVLGGIPGRLYTETLQCLCSDGGLSMSAAAPLLQRLRCHDYEAVPFELFRQGALTCAVFADYVRKSRCLYAAVASSPEQSADRALCCAVLAALRGALETSHGPDSVRYLEASAMISPGELARAMAGARATAGQQAGPTMDAREFEDEAAALFLARVRSVS
ncbi:tubulin polyglutamylase complex subunit 1 [Electrophorus electricus]|uniref:Tubulin polyglutamylase complex subunit 1-like C-terminal domain-containing protein n=1 Tax=Electrophorus electricus TaxID=8005 RepID=A0A4W4GBH9_ELEEL|nr:tubulin polyglutamylase complex subunit 1 [Electrophorus electricus]